MRVQPSTVIIMAPKGAGKTRHAEMLRAMFGCSCVVNDWDGRAPLPQGALALTSALHAAQPPAIATLQPDGADPSDKGGVVFWECPSNGDGVRHLVSLCAPPDPDYVLLRHGEVFHVARTNDLDRLAPCKGEADD